MENNKRYCAKCGYDFRDDMGTFEPFVINGLRYCKNCGEKKIEKQNRDNISEYATESQIY